MSVIATAVRHLLAAGVTGEALVSAIADMEAAQPKTDPVADKRRAYDRERKRYSKAVSGGIPVESAECMENPAPSPSFPQTPNQPHPHPGNNNTRARKGACPAKPDGVQNQTWDDFTEIRRRKRAPLTETALAGIAREAEKAGWSLEDALAKCVSRGWQGLEADWLKREEKPAGKTASADPLVASILARKAREASP